MNVSAKLHFSKLKLSTFRIHFITFYFCLSGRLIVTRIHVRKVALEDLSGSYREMLQEALLCQAQSTFPTRRNSPWRWGCCDSLHQCWYLKQKPHSQCSTCFLHTSPEHTYHCFKILALPLFHFSPDWKWACRRKGRWRGEEDMNTLQMTQFFLGLSLLSTKSYSSY